MIISLKTNGDRKLCQRQIKRKRDAVKRKEEKFIKYSEPTFAARIKISFVSAV